MYLRNGLISATELQVRELLLHKVDSDTLEEVLKLVENQHELLLKGYFKRKNYKRLLIEEYGSEEVLDMKLKQ